MCELWDRPSQSPDGEGCVRKNAIGVCFSMTKQDIWVTRSLVILISCFFYLAVIFANLR
jgi:hypothetical protein